MHGLFLWWPIGCFPVNVTQDGTTPLIGAVRGKFDKIVKLLLSSGANVDTPLRVMSGGPPVDFAPGFRDLTVLVLK